ncbi:MAG: hypothetical protein ACI9YT_002574, partial [Halobacteriales archaeon]
MGIKAAFVVSRAPSGHRTKRPDETPRRKRGTG